MREIKVAAAQLGPIQKADSRQAVVARMIELMKQAKAADCDLVVYPELALTTFFPRWYFEDRTEADIYFEREMPNAATRPLFEQAQEFGMAMSFGYAELTPEGRHFNTSILVDGTGAIVGKYRKVHLPGHAEFDPERRHQHLEKRYFEPGDLGFPVWRMHGGILGMCICNDRRWPETFRVMGLQGVEMVLVGFNTPSVNSQKESEGEAQRMFHHKLSVQAGAYQNSTFVVAVAKAGTEDGHHRADGRDPAAGMRNAPRAHRAPSLVVIAAARRCTAWPGRRKDQRRRRRSAMTVAAAESFPYFGAKCLR
jgi:predicted amidohydrolase